MATNNVINLKSSGIVSYDGAGTFTALANPLTVSNGGTGVASNTTDQLFCAGTTSTGPIQQVTSGVSGDTLVSAGAGALPVFQAFAPYFTSTFNFTSTNPADATLYVYQLGSALQTSTTRATFRVVSPVACTLKAAYGVFIVGGTLASAQTTTLQINVGAGSLSTIKVFDLNSTPDPISVTSLNVALAAGDFFRLELTATTWGTNPTVVSGTVTLVFQ